MRLLLPFLRPSLLPSITKMRPLSISANSSLISFGKRLLNVLFRRPIVPNSYSKQVFKFQKSSAIVTRVLEPLNSRFAALTRYASRIRPTLAAKLRRDAANKLASRRAGAVTTLGFSAVAFGNEGKGLVSKELEKESLVSELRKASSKLEFGPSKSKKLISELKHLVLGKVIAKGCNAVVCEAIDEDESKLALKMMFNYGIESDAHSIFRAMYRETLPANKIFLDSQINFSNGLLRSYFKNVDFEKFKLRPHANIVDMESAFVDQVPYIKEAREHFPLAMPPRLIEEGLGRNSSLFLVMKRYDCTVRSFLKEHKELKLKTSLLMLTQLLEGVTHLALNNISHRDLKCDNLLLDLSAGPSHPHLVIADFGCCLNNSLKLRFSSEYVDLGGNAALMAPEVSHAQPGLFSYVDYSKADVFAVGAIAHELFNLPNPLYIKGSHESTFEGVPSILSALINSGLMEELPQKRLRASVAANICQILLWAPKKWHQNNWIVSEKDVLQWLSMLGSILVLEVHRYREGPRAEELRVMQCFLRRANLKEINEALVWMQNAD